MLRFTEIFTFSSVPSRREGLSSGGGGTFNSKILFENNILLFSLLFSGNFCRMDKTLMEVDKVTIAPR